MEISIPYTAYYDTSDYRVRFFRKIDFNSNAVEARDCNCMLIYENWPSKLKLI